jgi:hypothetical protein
VKKRARKVEQERRKKKSGTETQNVEWSVGLNSPNIEPPQIDLQEEQDENVNKEGRKRKR